MILEVYLITKNHCLRILVLFFFFNDEKKLQMDYKNPNKYTCVSPFLDSVQAQVEAKTLDL